MTEHKEVVDALSRLTASDEIGTSPSLGKILNYVVSEELEGRGSSIKAYSVGIDALGKDPSFDPQTDPIVRVSVGRLRKALDLYYATHGKDDHIKITIPKGTYRPVFLVEEAASSSNRSVKIGNNYWARILMGRFSYALLALCALGLGFGFYFGMQTETGIDRLDHSNNGSAVIALIVEDATNASAPNNSKAQGEHFARELREALSRNNTYSIALPARNSANSQNEKRESGQPEKQVDFIISGSIEVESNENLRASVELISYRTNSLVWARSFALEKNTNSQILPSLVRKIAQELQTQIFGASIRGLEGRDPATLNARELFILATWVPGPAKSSLSWEKERLELAQLATQRDPNFGPPYSVMADKLAYLSSVDGPSNNDEALELAERYAKRTLELAPEDATSVFNVAQSQWHSGKLHDSMRTMNRVLELDPNNALARFFAMVYPYSCVTAPDEVMNAVISFDESLGADNPIRWVTLTWVGWLRSNRQEYAAALVAEQQAAQIFQIPYTVVRHAAILNQLGRSDEALELLLDQRENWPNIDPAHFSEVTIPRLCSEFPRAGGMIDFYRALTQSTKGRLSN